VKITLLYLGKKDQPWVTAGVQEYLTRLKHYVRIDTLRVPPPRISNSFTEAQCQQLESQALTKALPAAAQVVALDKSGKALTSEGLAHALDKLQSASHRVVVFAIGGAYGLSASFLKESSAVISLSPMTFPHQLARLLFMEQLYRAFTILKGESYHHA
jgi:23S rRNA (pseudouridine1915-N3)-methyltransferase